MSKKQLGQFFTSRADYILNGLEKYIKGKNIIDPFAGSGDLISWAEKNKAKSVRGYDIDKKLINKKIKYSDSIKSPLKYSFVLTNPPYLNVNKASIETKKQYFNFSEFEDLYQISLSSIMESEEGIIIVPINFLSAENSQKIRKLFFSKFVIVEMNYFKHQVFSDTTYNVIAFYYKRKKDDFENTFSIKTKIFPDKQNINVKLEKKFDWTIGGEELAIIKNQKNILGVYRLTEDFMISGEKEICAAYNHIKEIKRYNVSEICYKNFKNNIILLRAIDSGTDEGKIKLENIKKYGLDCLVGKESSRNMAYFMFEQDLSIENQEKIIELFNCEISKLRNSYFSLFLTNFRDNDRKRIGFDFAYKLINYLYFSKIEKNTYSINKNYQLSFI